MKGRIDASYVTIASKRYSYAIWVPVYQIRKYIHLSLITKQCGDITIVEITTCFNLGCGCQSLHNRCSAVSLVTRSLVLKGCSASLSDNGGCCSEIPINDQE